MNLRENRPAPALLIAMIALLMAMTGSAVAVVAAQSGDSLITQRSLSGNRLRLNTVTGKEVANLQWHNLNLINDWTTSKGARTPAWAVDALGVMHLRGAITAGNTTTFARLPESVRPSGNVYVSTNLDGAPGRIYINTAGYLQADYFDTFADAIAFTSLEGVTWAK